MQLDNFKILNKDPYFGNRMYKEAMKIENCLGNCNKEDGWLAKHGCQLYTRRKEYRRPKKTK